MMKKLSLIILNISLSRLRHFLRPNLSWDGYTEFVYPGGGVSSSGGQCHSVRVVIILNHGATSGSGQLLQPQVGYGLECTLVHIPLNGFFSCKSGMIFLGLSQCFYMGCALRRFGSWGNWVVLAPGGFQGDEPKFIAISPIPWL